MKRIILFVFCLLFSDVFLFATPVDVYLNNEFISKVQCDDVPINSSFNISVVNGDKHADIVLLLNGESLYRSHCDYLGHITTSYLKDINQSPLRVGVSFEPENGNKGVKFVFPLDSSYYIEISFGFYIRPTCRVYFSER